MRYAAVLIPLAASLVFVGSALAQPPVLSAVTVSSDRHPTAQFSAPKASDATIYVANKPDRATDGSFYDENVVDLDFLTADEIQSGTWTSSGQLDPGTYYVLLDADPDFDLCYDPGTDSYDPSCADGWSNMATLTVEVPPIRYAAGVSVLRYSREADLRLKATPLGETQRYRVCYLNRLKKKRCVSGTLDGYSWNSPATDEKLVSTRKLAASTTFTWYVGSRAVAKKRVKVRR
jgi:hypothetical protein